MNDKRKYNYCPDYIVKPGDVLEDYLDDLGMTQAELSDRTGLSKKTINEIIKAKSPITTETALKLERTLGRPAHFWINMERKYQEDLLRLAEQERMKADLAWLKNVPVSSMVRFGWIPRFKEKTETLEAVLCFFGVASPSQWKTVWREHQVAYRQAKHIENNAEAVSAWLRQGERQAQQIQCHPFDKRKFQATLRKVRDLTQESAPSDFVPQLVQMCADAGVAVVFVPELPKTGTYGATRWIGDRAIIQLSLRYKSNDHLWFTFFHEAGHVLKHGRKDIFIEGQHGLDGQKEEEANVFAQEQLIPPHAFRDFVAGWDGRSLDPIVGFAEQIEIAPGIVVGRLQHDGLLPKHIGNKLKVFYRWSCTEGMS